MCPETRTLEALAEEWERVARGKFSDAEHEKTDFGRRFIEHGAMCYVNCAQALREALGTMEGHSSAHNIAANEHAAAVEQQLIDAQARIAELEAALERAREMVSDWASYTPEYFRQKHDLAGCLAWLDAEIAGTKERIGKDQP